jgi:hypothetical protein
MYRSAESRGLLDLTLCSVRGQKVNKPKLPRWFRQHYFKGLWPSQAKFNPTICNDVSGLILLRGGACWRSIGRRDISELYGICIYILSISPILAQSQLTSAATSRTLPCAQWLPPYTHDNGFCRTGPLLLLCWTGRTLRSSWSIRGSNHFALPRFY